MNSTVHFVIVQGTVSIASLLGAATETDKKGKDYYKLEILSRTGMGLGCLFSRLPCFVRPNPRVGQNHSHNVQVFKTSKCVCDMISREFRGGAQKLY